MIETQKGELISIVIPVYNVQDYIEKCYESIKNQTYTNLEIIFVDDGATDKSGKICDEFAETDKRIKVFHTENRGVSAARNLGLKHCCGEYVMFMDSDDYINPICVECLYELIKRDGTQYAIGGVEKIGINQLPAFEIPDYGKHMVLEAKEAIIRLMYRKGLDTYVYSKLYKKDLIESVEFAEGKLCEDIPFTFEVMNKVKQVSYIGCTIYYYVQRDGSYMHSSFSERTMDGVNFSKEIMDSTMGDSSLYKATASKYFFILLDVLIHIDDKHLIEKEYIISEIKQIRKMILQDSDNKISQRMMAGATFLPSIVYIKIAQIYKKAMNRKFK